MEAAAGVSARDVRILSATETELTTLRCPPPGGCRFRVRPTNIDGWTEWSLGSEMALTTRLPPAPLHALRLELRLASPFTQDAALLDEVLMRDLARALHVSRAAISLVEVRLSAEFVTLDVLPPDAFATAARLHRLILTPASSLHNGQATRSIDASYGITLIHRDGQAEPFRPADERAFPTLDTTLEMVEAAIERTLGLSPRDDVFWQAGAGLVVTLGVLLGCCSGAVRRAVRGGAAPRYKYSRTLQSADDDDDISAWGYSARSGPSQRRGFGEEDELDELGEEGEESEEGDDAGIRPRYRVLDEHGGGGSSALSALEQAAAEANGLPQASASAVDELRRAAHAAGVVSPLPSKLPFVQLTHASRTAVSQGAQRLTKPKQGKEEILHL